MPPSQLKRLKSSLREQGITGPQKSKKQKKAARGKDVKERVQRNVALQQLRDSFNPFELKAVSSRPAKFQHATANGSTGKYRQVLHRPGVSKSAGEEMRRSQLLPEMQKRNKVGGLVDRRIGEGDTSLTAEERAVQRFAQEKQRKKGSGLFDLEASDEDEPKISLTHGGRGLDELPADDFGEDLSGDDDDRIDGELLRRKRRRSGDSGDEMAGDEEPEEQPERKKTKKEVMEEVIAKSKLHKYERQKTKEDDDELREELDMGMNDVLALLQGYKRPLSTEATAARNAADATGPTMNADRQKLMDGMDRAKVDKQYDARLKQLAQDARAKPSERSKTEEEKTREEAERLKRLEERRLQRMRGEDVSDDGIEAEHTQLDQDMEDNDKELLDEAGEFGFTTSTSRPKPEQRPLVLDDEDEFALEDDLVASGSELDLDTDLEGGQGSDEETPDEEAELGDEEDEFVRDILDDTVNGEVKSHITPTATAGIAYTYPCPRSHAEFLDIVRDTPVDQLPTIIQRVRALHHPSINSSNTEKMIDFSSVLVEHLSYMGIHKQSLAVAEQIMRHLHSLSRTYPDTVAKAFRGQLQDMHTRKDVHAGDLVVLTAIGSIFPTSDHFHAVVTPAMTLMARWLGMTNPASDQQHATGAFLVALCAKYQAMSKRYIPEATRFALRALNRKTDLTIQQKDVHIANLLALALLWKDKPAFTEIFAPFLPLLNSHAKPLQTLKTLLTQACINRRPLLLHNHRPLPIRTSIPKFEDAFNPDKHYDPDKERSDSRKLQQEYKRERKGALRELRKDSNFVARTQLKEKRERDEEYGKKMRRLVAEVQGHEGQEGNSYEREKERRGRRGKGKK